MDKIVEKIFKVTETGYTIQGQTILENKDLIVHITGGNVPHLGVIVSYDCKKDKVDEIRYYSHNNHDHKDFYLAERFVKDIKDSLPGSLCVTAGVHVDGITKEQISAAFTMMDELADQTKAWLKTLPKDFVDPQYTTGITDEEMHLK